MRLLVVGAGASYATKDVEVGYYHALAELGHDLSPFALDHRIDAATQYLNFVWRRGGRKESKPTRFDASYVASQGILERALFHDLDGVLFITAHHVPVQSYLLLKKAGVRAAAIFTESPYEDGFYELLLPYLDVAWTNERTSVARLRQINPNVHYLPACYDPAKHFPPGVNDIPDVAHHDVVFVGSGFEERIAMLSQVDWTGIDLGLYGWWELLGSRHRLRRFLRGGIADNATTAQLYRNARVGLNFYRTSLGMARGVPHLESLIKAESLNPRAYEIAACGTLQVSDWRAEIRDVLDLGVHWFSEPAALERTIRTASTFTEGEHRPEVVDSALKAVQGQTFLARARQVEHDLCSAWGLAPVQPLTAA